MIELLLSGAGSFHAAGSLLRDSFGLSSMALQYFLGLEDGAVSFLHCVERVLCAC